jgi:hypothetical protein
MYSDRHKKVAKETTKNPVLSVRKSQVLAEKKYYKVQPYRK